MGTLPGGTVALTLCGLFLAFFNLVKMSKSLAREDAREKLEKSLEKPPDSLLRSVIEKPPEADPPSSSAESGS
jgi:hypothetical protein